MIRKFVKIELLEALKVNLINFKLISHSTIHNKVQNPEKKENFTLEQFRF